MSINRNTEELSLTFSRKKLKAAEAYEEILKPLALERERAGKKIALHQNSDEGETLKIVEKN